MAQKRMFSLKVVDTDKFLEMPISSRLLYYELSMRADDDGFVDNWKKILTFTGLKEDDLKILIAKSYVIPFESGVIVIKHWRLNNYLQNDRIVPTIYQEELSQLELDKGVYNFKENDEMYTKCIHSIDKNSIDKNSIVNNMSKNETFLDQKNTTKKNDNTIYKEEFEILWVKYPKRVGKKEALESYIKARKEGTSFETIEEGLHNYIEYCNKTSWYSPKDACRWFKKRSWEDDLNVTPKDPYADVIAKIEREKLEKEKEIG